MYSTTNNSESDNTNTGLYIPDVTGMTNLEAAFAYAQAGFYVLPVKRGTKHPGSIVGSSWPTLSSKDPEQIAAWWSGTSHGIAIHAGRSGAVILDVDAFGNAPDEVLLAVETTGCPFQSTRTNDSQRGHYLFANTTGRRIGNSVGDLATAPTWGDARGANGVIIVEPTEHPNPDGQYKWVRTGELPDLPDYIADKLPDSTNPEDTVTDAQVEEFLTEHNTCRNANALNALVNSVKAKLEAGASCHTSILGAVTTAMAEAASGAYPARAAANAFRNLHHDTVTTGTSTGRVETPQAAKGQFDSMLAWAVAQATPAKVAETQQHLSTVYKKIVPPTDTSGGQTSAAQEGTEAANSAPDDGYWPSPGKALKVAQRIVAEQHTTSGGASTLRYWQGRFVKWVGPHWEEIENTELEAQTYKLLDGAEYLREVKEHGHTVFKPTEWNPDNPKVIKVHKAIEAITFLPKTTEDPCWLEDTPLGGRVVSCANGLLDLDKRKLYEHTPAYFNQVSVPFDYDPEAPPPVAWFKFLESVWQDDPESVALLQEFIGYIISGRTDMQKILCIVGPTRSGKGTIGRMLNKLIGKGNIAAPTLASLSNGQFGLAPLIGKSLAIVSDARLGKGSSSTVVERLLSVSGEDTLTIDIKYREPWSGKLPTRFAILTNELPAFSDASGAIANRLVILQMSNSFLGREDRTLGDRLADELPGILNWALEGLDRLDKQGHFTVPEASDQATTMMLDMASPVAAFVREMCVVDPGAEVPKTKLYNCWKDWCDEAGHKAGSDAEFSKDLVAAVPRVKAPRGQVRRHDGRYRVFTGIDINAEVANERLAGELSANELGASNAVL